MTEFTDQTRILVYAGVRHDFTDMTRSFTYYLLAADAMNDGSAIAAQLDADRGAKALWYKAQLDPHHVTQIGGMLQVNMQVGPDHYSVYTQGRTPLGAWKNREDVLRWQMEETESTAHFDAVKRAADDQVDPLYEALEPIREAYSEASRSTKIAIMTKVIDYITRPTRLTVQKRDAAAVRRGRKQGYRQGYESGVKQEQARQKKEAAAALRAAKAAARAKKQEEAAAKKAAAAAEKAAKKAAQPV